MKNNTNLDFDKLRGGNFIEAAIQRLKGFNAIGQNLCGRITGIELIPEEAKKATDRATLYGLDSATIINNDFFSFKK